MKNKQQQRSRQMVEINLYRQLCIELLKIITAAGIKLPPNILAVINTAFPIASQTNATALIYEKRCRYCRLSKKCLTGQFRFQKNGCGDKFKKKIRYFWKEVK
jgi:hypothetical protein